MFSILIKFLKKASKKREACVIIGIGSGPSFLHSDFWGRSFRRQYSPFFALFREVFDLF